MAVPESILKKRRTQEALLAKKAADTAATKKVSMWECVRACMRVGYVWCLGLGGGSCGAGCQG